MYALTVLIMSSVGFIVGNFMALTVNLLPKILLEGCDKGREPKDIFWIFLKNPISLNYHDKRKLRIHLFELSMALIFGASALLFPFNLNLLFSLAMISILVCCFFTDYEYGILPDQLTFTLIWLGLIASILPVNIDSREAIIGSVLGYGVFWAFNELYKYLRGFDGMYPGDFKLNAGIGACLGYKLLIPVVVISLILLVLINVFSVFYKRKRLEAEDLYKEIPYACSITIVTVIANCMVLMGYYSSNNS